ncbi:MAG: phosphoribosylamine--glycine ligase, partial [Hyphomicrobiales bacterium]|nr:phosphoribosylamine--glycine ligase [Hyphomicrobiales bacterium]
EGDVGPNTGGMGAYSPAPRMDAALQRQVMAQIIEPTLRAMAARGTPFSGMLFAGLMLTGAGPKLIEFNTRFGDPETQVLMARLEDDLLELLDASARGTLAGRAVKFSKDVALTLVIAAQGYPGTPRANGAIFNLDAAAAGEGVIITQAGTKLVNGQLVASGGRVLNITAIGKDFSQAAGRAYAAAEKVDFADGFYRRDIGWRVLR